MGGQVYGKAADPRRKEMMIKKILPIVLLLSIVCAGCGYSTRSLLPGNLRSIYIEPFKNGIIYTTENSRTIYLPLLEVKARNAIVDRYLFDGNLDIGQAGSSDLLLKGELNGFERDALRYTENNDVLEYRIRVIVSLVLWDTAQQKILWEEPGFTGETSYFPTGSQAKSENTAIEDALLDLARRVVARTVEDW